MAKFIIHWDVGHGSRDAEIIEAENEEKALAAAYEAWRQNAEDNADYDAKPYSADLAEDFGLALEDEGQ